MDKALQHCSVSKLCFVDCENLADITVSVEEIISVQKVKNNKLNKDLFATHCKHFAAQFTSIVIEKDYLKYNKSALKVNSTTINKGNNPQELANFMAHWL